MGWFAKTIGMQEVYEQESDDLEAYIDQDLANNNLDNAQINQVNPDVSLFHNYEAGTSSLVQIIAAAAVLAKTRISSLVKSFARPGLNSLKPRPQTVLPKTTINPNLVNRAHAVLQFFPNPNFDQTQAMGFFGMKIALRPTPVVAKKVDAEQDALYRYNLSLLAKKHRNSL